MFDQVQWVVVVDDAPAVRRRAIRSLRPLLPRAGFAEAGDLAGGRRLLAGAADLLLLDHYLPDGVGLHLLDWLRQRRVELPVVYLTSVRSAEVAVAAMKAGARDYVVKARDWPGALAGAVAGVLEQWERHRGEAAALARLREAACRDPLTGLWNRRVLEDPGVAAAWSTGPLAVAMIDLDGFKAVNDTLGHPAGDLLLQQVARALRAATRDTDLLLRYGGDEFLAVLPRLQPEDVAPWAARVRTDLAAATAAMGGLPRGLGASIGVAVGSGDLQALIARADALMYQDKRARSAR